MITFTPKLILTTLIMTFVNYTLAYFISSRETLLDYKNLLLIFIFSSLWTYYLSLFKHKKLLISMYITSCLLGFLVPLLAYFSEPTFLQRLMKDFLFWYTLPLIPITASLWIKNSSKNLSYFATVSYILAVVPLSIIVLYYATFNAQLSTDSILAILQTNKQEATEFIYTYLSFSKMITFIIGAFLGVALIFRSFKALFSGEPVSPQLHSRNFWLCCNLVLIISCLMFAEKSYWTRTYNNALKQNKMINTFSIHSKERIQNLNNDSYLKSGSTNANFALIIGETHARSNMSAYGYQRDTTPWLSAAVSNNEVVLLKNGFSNSGATTPSLQYALTATNQYNNINFQDAITITEIARASGFNVIWISNQIDDNIAGLIGHEANQQYWLNQHHNDTWMRQKNNAFDDKIVTCLENLPKPNSKTLYIINLLGSHAAYNCRYPSSFNKWDDTNNLLNAYDNSILYNDYIMSKIHHILFNKLNVDAMMYFADHGEELKLKFCHGVEYFYNNYKKHPSSREIVKIPIYFSFSNKYKQLYPELTTNLNLNKDKFFTNDMAYDTMLGIMHIAPPYYSSKYNITSNDYNMSLNELRTIHGKVKLEECL